MNRSFGVARPGVLALGLAIAVGMSSRVLAADEIDEALSTAGKVWFEKYCMPCHGPGGAPGDAVYSATKEPVDLRTYVQRHGGKFPANDWLAVIADARPGGVTNAGEGAAGGSRWRSQEPVDSDLGRAGQATREPMHNRGGWWRAACWPASPERLDDGSSW